MITRTIEKVNAVIADIDGNITEREYFGSNITATKVKKLYEKETGVRADKVEMNCEAIKCSMTEAEFVHYSKEMK